MTRILAVDDDERILKLIRNALVKEGYEVTVQSDPRKISGLKLTDYQLILLDVMMPGIDGFALCEEIRGRVDCPILFLTAKTRETDIMKGLGIGGDDYITKPFGIGELRARVAAHLRRETREKNAFRFCYVNDFPMFERDEETKQIGFTHNPFSMPQGGLKALEEEDPLDILAYQYDIVCNGVELSSGAVRNHDIQIMVKAFEIAGYDEETLKSKFGALYQAFQFGAPPHAGMAPGIDRMIMLLRGEENIREVIAFPMSGSGQDLMCGSPSEVTEMQLREVHIKVRD